MSEIHTLPAQPKERAGKGAARAARRAGRVPGVIYGAKEDPIMVTLDPRDLLREMHTGTFFATLLDVDVGGNKLRVLPRDLQLHPVTDQPLHVDLLRVSATTLVTVNVPCEFINEERSPGIRRGGVLNVVRYEIEFECRADAIPQHIVVDLAGRDIGDSIHISMVSLPEGVTPTITDRDFTIATIAAPSVMEEPTAAEEAYGAAAEEEAEEAAEGEEEEEEGEKG